MKPGAAGSIIAGRFQLVAQVASGGMGTVHRAFDLTRQRAVAVKLLSDVGSVEAAERFRREAGLLAELRHPGIVEFVDAGVLEDGGMYMAMQWLEGIDLAQRLVAGPLSCADAVRLVRAIAEALAVAHARGVLHRDIKPQNIFLREGDVDRPVLLDFGIATLAGMSSGITRTGLTIGTPGFMAPEQARGERSLDARVDVYGLGCLLFQCVTGSPPFVGPTPIAIVAEVLLKEAPRLKTRAPDVPAELDELVASMLTKDAARRPADGRFVAERLRQIEGRFPLPQRAGAAGVTGEERRMVAVLSAVLPAAAPAKTAAGTTPMRGTFLPKLAVEHGGALSRVTSGVAFIVFTSDESIAEASTRAASAALAIVRADPEVAVGLAVGPSQIGGGLDGTLVERLGSLAAGPGAVLCDTTARSMLLAGFVFEQVERGFRLVGGRAADEPVRYTPFVGRERELRSLLDALDAVIDDRAARAALLVGAPGLGKSRLVRELLVLLDQRDAPPSVVDARADPLRRDTPLSLLGQLVHGGLRLEASVDELGKTALLAALAPFCPDVSERRRAAAFLSIAADLPVDIPELEPELAAARRDPQLLEDQVGRAFATLLEGLLRVRGSLVLIVDDAHAADAVSCRILGKVLRRLAEQPVYVIGCARPEIDDRFQHAMRDVPLERIQLAGLPKRSADKLVRAALGDRATEELVGRIVQQGEGSPLFLQELAAFAAEQKVDTVPTGVIASLEGRLLRLDPTARKILRAASVFGETFWDGGVLALLGEGTPESFSLREWLTFLLERDLIVVQRTTRYAGHTELSFRHSLMRDVAHTMLTPEDRAKGHRLAAAWLQRAGEREPIVLAVHLDAALDASAAAPHWARAGKLAYARNDAPHAVEWLERALSQGLAGPDRAEALVVLTNALSWLGQLDRAERRGIEAVASFLQGTQGWVDATTALVRVQGRRDETRATDAIKRLIEAVRRDRSLRPDPEALSVLMPIPLRRGLKRLAADIIDVLGEAALAHAPNDPGVRASILRCRSWQAMFDWDYTSCAAYDREALECFKAAGDQRQSCRSQFDVAFDLMLLGDYERAEQMLLETVVEARRLGLDPMENLALHNLSFALHRQGRSKEGIELQRRCLEYALERHDRVAEVHARHYLAIILFEIDDPGAEKELERCLGIAEGISIRWDTLARLGLIALRRGAAGLARLRIAEASHGARELQNAEDGQMIVHLAAAAVARTFGEDDRARAILLEAKTNLLAAAAKIADPAVRASFLGRVPEHRRILELCP